jgi:hypothetical protein
VDIDPRTSLPATGPDASDGCPFPMDREALLTNQEE